ncbi:MAG: patatin-like phospholipase family protein [Deltaproteobacteria bacterium]|nr:patatin-like phospholipase family protein [Deltaproteobacteria bacterium]
MPFDAVVFAGGGCRCAWQAGFWRAAGHALEPRTVAAVSAGSAFACASIAGITDQVIADFERRSRENPGNIHWRQALGRGPLFPHARIYRQAILDCIDDEAFERLQQGPEIRVLLAHPPAVGGAAPWLLAGLLAYKLDRLVRRRVHVRWSRALGFELAVATVDRCADVGELADLILQSSCTPPVTPLLRRAGRAVVDGGIIDSVPVELADDHERQLVLLTRRYPSRMLPQLPGRTYVQPSKKLPISAWDYSNPSGLRASYELGKLDGDRFVASFGS